MARRSVSLVLLVPLVAVVSATVTALVVALVVPAERVLDVDTAVSEAEVGVGPVGAVESPAPGSP